MPIQLCPQLASYLAPFFHAKGSPKTIHQTNTLFRSWDRSSRVFPHTTKAGTSTKSCERKAQPHSVLLPRQRACAVRMAKDAMREYTSGLGIPPKPNTFHAMQAPEAGSPSLMASRLRCMPVGMIETLYGLSSSCMEIDMNAALKWSTNTSTSFTLQFFDNQAKSLAWSIPRGRTCLSGTRAASIT